MSSGPGRRVSRQDIQLVQNLIERCLQLYMTQKEVVDTLLAQAKIEPGFTELVWQKLEEENREFFQAYYLRVFGAESNVLEARPTIGDASFSTVESSTQPMNEPILDAGISSYGFLGQIPRSFSLSDLTADFSQSSDILENYSRSPFLATDNETFLDSHERDQGDNTRLDTISEGMSYEGFRNGQH